MLPIGQLGKLPAIVDPKRRFSLRSVVKSALPPPPPWVDWHHGIPSYGVMGNDSLGDCTCAALGHAEQIISVNAPGMSEITVPDSSVISLYEGACGYNPADPSTDQGGFEVNVLNYVRKNGLFGVDSLIAYADPDLGDLTHVKQAIQLFQGLYIGVQFPEGTLDKEVWDSKVKPQPNDPGHAVYVVGYNEYGLVVVTWGYLKNMTWDFFANCCDEAHALITQNGLGHFGGQVNLDAIEQMLQDVSNDPVSLAPEVSSTPEPEGAILQPIEKPTQPDMTGAETGPSDPQKPVVWLEPPVVIHGPLPDPLPVFPGIDVPAVAAEEKAKEETETHGAD